MYFSILQTYFNSKLLKKNLKKIYDQNYFFCFLFFFFNFFGTKLKKNFPSSLKSLKITLKNCKTIAEKLKEDIFLVKQTIFALFVCSSY